jgi:hypothetical protein
LLGSFFNPGDGGDMLLSVDCRALCHGRQLFITTAVRTSDAAITLFFTNAQHVFGIVRSRVDSHFLWDECIMMEMNMKYIKFEKKVKLSP